MTERLTIGRHALTRQQTQVALLCAQGLTNKEIAWRLGRSEQTVKNHLSQIYEQLDVGNRTELARAVWMAAEVTAICEELRAPRGAGAP